MYALIGWDDPAEADLISLFLNQIEGTTSEVCTDPKVFLARAGSGVEYDIVLVADSFPDPDRAFFIFQQLHSDHPDWPILVGCRAESMFAIARFLTAGARNYVIRDDGTRNFVFLLHNLLEGTVTSVRAEREQQIAQLLRQEVDSVRRLQESILPASIECPAGYEIVARYETSQIQVLGGKPVVMAGGDYYDVVRLDDNAIAVLVGDASGHGMRACMSIMTMHALIRMVHGWNRGNGEALDSGDHWAHNPGRLITEVNQWLCQQQIVNEEGGFITLLYGVLRTDRNEFWWSSAGHPFPLLHRPDKNAVTAIGTEDHGGLPLGIDDNAEYATYCANLPPASRLLVYTDGLADAIAPGETHCEFGATGIAGALKAAPNATLSEGLDRLFEASRAFTGETGRHDDTSVVFIGRTT